MEERLFITKSEYAKYVERDKGTITRWIRDGIAVVNDDGQIDVVQSEIRRREHFGLSDQLNGKSHYDTLKAKIQAEMAELDLAERKKGLVQKKLVEDQAFKAGKIVTDGLLLMAQVSSRELFECQDEKELEDMLMVHIQKILDELRNDIKNI